MYAAISEGSGADFARADDDVELRRLLRENPMPGRFGLTLEREPSFFLGATVEGDVHQTLVVRAPGGGGLVAMASRAVRDAWLDGRPGRLGYLSQLRVDRGARGGEAVLDILDALRGMDLPFHIATILEDNRGFRRAVERSSPWKPTFRPVARLASLALPLWGRCRFPRPPRTEIRRGSVDLLDGILACLARNHAACQLAPVWRREDLLDPERARDLRPDDFRVALRGGRVVGCLAAWDQRGYKQTVVRGTEDVLGPLRPIWDLASRATGLPRLPAPGEQLPHAFVSHAAVDGEDPEVFLSLLGSAYDDLAAEGGYAYLALGLNDRSPLLPRVKASLGHLEQGVIVYLVYFEQGAHAASALDLHRPVHLEIAVL